jgi:glycosyltransferase involved in cell wall biosynthesis
VVNRAVAQRRPLIRTRHIAQAVRPHAANRWLYRHATDRVVTVSEAIRGQYLAAGLLDAARVSAMPGGADTERYRPQPADPDLRERLGGIPGVPLVGLVAGLRVMKGHGVALEAAARLHAAGMRIRLVFVGAGRHEGAVREAVARSGLAEQVSLVGFADDLPAVFAALDAVLYVPVESDGMSRVVFECLAAGRPLVASRVGVVAEVLEDDRHALLVPAGDAGALAATLGRLLGDPARAARLGVAGRGLVEARYSGARLAAALEELYARLAGRAAA